MSLYLGSRQLVPGRPARWWADAFFRFLAMTQSLAFAALLVAVVFFRQFVMPFVIAVVVLMALATILGLVIRIRGIPNDRREVEAGYTTLAGAHQELDQVDPATGRVIRRAGDPFLRERSRFARMAPAFSITVAVVIVAFLGYQVALGRGPAIGVLAAIGVGVIAWGCWAAYVRAATKRNLADAAQLFPGAQRFACSRNPDLLHTLRLVDAGFAERDTARKFPIPFVAAVYPQGVHLVASSWGAPVTVPWDGVSGVRHGWVTVGRNTMLAAEVVLAAEDGELVLPFTVAVATNFSDRDTPTDALLAALTDALQRRGTQRPRVVD